MRYFKITSIAYFLFLLCIFSSCIGEFKADFFNKYAKDKDSRPDEVIRELQIQKGEKIADLGSGGGYYTFRFSEEVGIEGIVFAVDTDSSLLDRLKSESVKKKIENIEFILARQNQSGLKENSVDLLFVRDVFHHLPEPDKYFCNIKNALKATGRVAIIDYKKTGSLSFVTLFGHYTDPEVIVKTLENCGFILDKKHDFLTKQSFQIFKIDPSKSQKN